MGFIGLTRNENVKSEAVLTHVGRRPYDWVSQSNHVHAVRSIFGGIQDVRPWLGRVGSCKAPFSDRWRSEWNSQVRLVRLSCDVTTYLEVIGDCGLVKLNLTSSRLLVRSLYRSISCLNNRPTLRNNCADEQGSKKCEKHFV